jgi:DNA mismatch repair ATPase MutS
VGTNAVLALAGAPVRAVSLRLSPVAIGASIRIQDSLQDGESRFYAEIKRVRQVLDLARGDSSLLFLLDEIFDGTNSAERRVGAEAVVRSLLKRRAIGLVTSHDLALADMAVSLAPRAGNVHFEDHLEGDRMAFDYKIKPGPVVRGNALRLMRAVGLEV